MNYVRLIIAITAAFLFVFSFELVYHGLLLRPVYESTMSLWRPETDMMKLMPMALSVQFGYAALTVVLFTALSPDTGVKQGLRFGALLGFLLGLLQIGAYVYIPMPLQLASSWFAGLFFETLCISVMTSLIYKKP